MVNVEWLMVNGRQAIGLDLFILPDNTYSLSLCILRKKGSKISTERSVSGIKDIASLKEYLSPALPVSLVIGGKGLLHKKVARAEGESSYAKASADKSDSLLLQKVLPNANIGDFYIQRTPAGADKHFVSVARKNVIDALLKELNDAGYTITSCSFGPFCINALLPMLPSSAVYTEIATRHYQLNISDSRIVEQSAPPPSQGELVPSLTREGQGVVLTIGEERIDFKSLLSFAVAFSSLLNLHANTIPSVTGSREDFRQKTIFQKTLKVSLAAIFLLLLVNYFAFDHFWKKSNELKSRYSLNQESVQKLEKLKKGIAEKEQFYERTNILTPSRTSFYADRIAAELPEHIKLSRLEIHPKQKSKEEESLSFSSRTVNVKGLCRKSIELNDWMKEIRKNKWVSEVKLLNYSQDKDGGEFNLEIQLN